MNNVYTESSSYDDETLWHENMGSSTYSLIQQWIKLESLPSNSCLLDDIRANIRLVCITRSTNWRLDPHDPKYGDSSKEVLNQSTDIIRAFQNLQKLIHNVPGLEKMSKSKLKSELKRIRSEAYNSLVHHLSNPSINLL